MPSDQPGAETSWLLDLLDLVERVARGGRGSTLRAMAVALASLAVVAGVTIGLGMGYARLTEPDVIAFGKTVVRYSHGGTRAEAQALWDILVAESLVSPAHNYGDWAWTLDVRREGGRRVVELEPQGDLTSDDPELDCVIVMSLLSRGAFADEPLDIWLRDKTRGRHIKVPWEDRRRRFVGDGGVVEYRQGGQESEARDVARVLQEHHLFEPGENGKALVKRAGGTHVVGFVIDVSHTGGKSLEQILDVKTQLRSLAETFSTEVFGGRPVDIWLLYTDPDHHPGESQEVLPWDSRPSASVR